MVHHELVGEFAPVLRVGHLLVHEGVEDGDAAVGGEGEGDVLVELGEVGADRLVAELGHAQDRALLVLDREAQDRPGNRNKNSWQNGFL